jgi:hypothetical protein
VFLVDKPFYAVVRVVELLVDRDAGTAAGVYRWLGAAVPPAHRRAFLAAANDLLRLRNRLETAPVDAFFGMLDVLRLAGPPPDEVEEVLAKLRAAGPRVDALRAGLVADPVPLADPLTPAIARAVDHAGGGPVTVVHDRTNTLTAARIAELERNLPSLAAVRLVASEDDARVQVADFLAGIARRLTQDALDGTGPDPELGALLRPYVDPASILAGAAQ